jgi:hypothetical protein
MLTHPRRRALLASLLGLALVAAPVGLMGSMAGARSTQNAAAQSPPLSSTIQLPVLWQGETPFSQPYRDSRLATKAWRAEQAFWYANAPADYFPGWDCVCPTAEKAEQNIVAACHDFPDLPDVFGPGALRRACDEGVAGNLALATAADGWRQAEAGFTPEQAAWSSYYLDREMDALSEFVYGPADSPTGVSYRDSKAAVWQNGLRVVNLTLTAELLRRLGLLTPARQQRAEELLSAVARAWYAAWWATGIQPSTGVTLTTLTAAQSPAVSLAGHPVAATHAYTFTWDADHGNTSAEETAWLGAGAMLATRVLGPRLPDGDAIYSAARHYIDFSLTYNRPDPLHAGASIRTLNAETTGGAYGQRRYWVENHVPDTPSIPYMGSAWHFIGMALLASDQNGAAGWPSLAPDKTQWRTLTLSAGETLRAPDGTFLPLLDPAGRIDYNLDAFPAWVTPCGTFIAGRQYARTGATDLWSPRFVSEVGIPVGIDLITSGWPILRLAGERADVATRNTWADRLAAIYDAYAAHPPAPHTIACATAPWVSRNPAYQWSRIAAALAIGALEADGVTVQPWPAPTTVSTP